MYIYIIFRWWILRWQSWKFSQSLWRNIARWGTPYVHRHFRQILKICFSRCWEKAGIATWLSPSNYKNQTKSQWFRYALCLCPMNILYYILFDMLFYFIYLVQSHSEHINCVILMLAEKFVALRDLFSVLWK